MLALQGLVDAQIGYRRAAGSTRASFSLSRADGISLSAPTMAESNGRNANGDSKDRTDGGLVHLQNRNLQSLDQDILYHLSLGTRSHDLVEMFGDVKFVCMGGSAKRMEHFADYAMSQLADVFPAGTVVQDLQDHSHRYSMYKVGPVLSISHGIGTPSLQILLHEVIKLMHYARVKDPVFVRIGTSGGIGVEPGTVVVSDGAVNELMEPYHEQAVCGKMVKRSTKLNQDLAREIRDLRRQSDEFQVVNAKTMCAMDFYEGQGRLDGAFCYHTEEDKVQYLRELHKAGVRNIEMEATCFAAVTHLASIRSAIVCVTFLDRFKGDQVCPPKSVLSQWEVRPQEIVCRFIRRHLQSRTN
ncbi:uridine phosphorylase 1-like isoform X1 [Phymastichus coffea]|uniref:uridine phosphorylase 1-like isoform X1 n=1 Tax=Phymastichus coffea TaxID=108790 RepID=UPI00273B89F3|nr:uridine phosphorylase 1-like isoform X1 [Phymastichus coffea]